MTRTLESISKDLYIIEKEYGNKTHTLFTIAEDHKYILHIFHKVSNILKLISVSSHKLENNDDFP